MSWSALTLDRAQAAATRELAEGERAEAARALDALRAAEPALARGGAAALRRLSAALLAGPASEASGPLHARSLEDEARLAWLAGGASFAERRRARHDALDAAVAAADQREADWAALWAAIERAGLTALRIALPFLLAAAGI
ncbi:MAG: hypothetical protein AB7O37_23245 [Vicinamibacteria bacterium]